jgi:NADH-quinone oxidoreductase subunit J
MRTEPTRDRRFFGRKGREERSGTEMIMEHLPQLFFFYHAVVIVGLSLLVVTRRNPVHSVLFMLVLFFHIASLYLFLQAEFMAAIQIIVYAGAILVLFLFVILLMNLKEELLTFRFVSSWPTGMVIAGALFAAIVLSVFSLELGPSSEFDIAYIEETSNLKAVGTQLYTRYIFPFEIASVVLLVAIIGAITLAKKRLVS